MAGRGNRSGRYNQGGNKNSQRGSQTGFKGGKRTGGGPGDRAPSSSSTLRESPIFGYDGDIPSPDQDVFNLEQRVVSQSASSMQRLAGQMSELKVGPRSKVQVTPLQDRFPTRPSYGSQGKRVVLWANYFKVVTKLDVLYKYTVDVKEIKDKPETKGKGKSQAPGESQMKEVKGRKLFLVIRAVLGKLREADESMVVATEFKSQLVSPSKIEFPSKMRVSIPAPANPDRQEIFEVTFHGPNEARVDEMMKYLGHSPGTESRDTIFPKYPEVVDALNVIFGYSPRSRVEDISSIGSSHFDLVKGRQVASEKLFNKFARRPLEIIRGYVQSARLGTGCLLLNVNVTHGVFKVGGNLGKLLSDFKAGEVEKDQSIQNLKMFSKLLPKTRVLFQMKQSDGKMVSLQKTIYGLAQASEIRRRSGNALQISNGREFLGPRHVRFFLEQDGQPGHWITVFDHFKQKYGITPKDYPLINLGTADKPAFFPAEHVTIQPGQHAKVKLHGAETTQLLNTACRSPRPNADSITKDGRSTLGLDGASLNRFGISVDKKLLTVHGRVLPTPTVIYQPGDVGVVPKNGSWNMASRKVFKAGAKIQRWSYLNLSPEIDGFTKESVVRFSKFMIDNMGININRYPVDPMGTVIGNEPVTNPKLEAFFKWAQQNKVEFLLIILGSTEPGVYNRVKTLGDCVYGIHTSCVLQKAFCKAPPGYLTNVALKWNLKTGGVNHKLKQDLDLVKKGNTMVVGYDVTHPTNMPLGKSDKIPSLVGLVSSIDCHLGQWPSVSWEQNSKKEMLSQRLTDTIISRLRLWQRHNRNQLPENIIIFRDGVSESQFAQVLDQELPLIRAAFQSTYKEVPPRVTILVSVKRHQTRFYPTNEKDSIRHNIQNGTVVDRGVTQANVWDFFLTAHAAIKGTARPAHYTVLLDEIFRAKYNDKAVDELEKFTHELCYIYGRATKAVSICPPAYYADIVCTRARAHRPEYNDAGEAESVVPGRPYASLPKQVHRNLEDTMYYI